jgi:predicted DNA-binding transcriptional regulator YafY
MTTAQLRLERILWILPAAARADGADVHALAAALGVTPETVLADLEEATARCYHHPGGTVEPFSIFVDERRVRVDAPAEFQRPVRLNEREALALGLGLRALAAEAGADRRDDILELAARLELELATDPAASVTDVSGGAGATGIGEDGVDYEPPGVALAFGDDGFRGAVADALEQGVVCGLWYVKPGDVGPERRLVAPYRIIHADGRWYVAGYDIERDGLRFFRMDRVVDVEPTPDAAPAAPADLDDWLRAAPFSASEEVEVAVRYAPHVAPWVLEWSDGGAAGEEEDGSVRVRHRVADARWIVRHVLQYGGAAVVEAPAEAREWVRDAAARIP